MNTQNKIKKVVSVVLVTALIAIGAAILSTFKPTEAFAADTYSLGNVMNTVVSTAKSISAGATNGTSAATNGAYTAAIGAAGANFNATETNFVCLNSGLDGNWATLTFGARGLTAGSATVGLVTSLVYTVTSTPRGLQANITNGTATGWGGSSQARSVFGTFTLTVNTNVDVLTNILLTPNSTPAFNRNLNLYLENITCNASNNFATNLIVGFMESKGELP